MPSRTDVGEIWHTGLGGLLHPHWCNKSPLHDQKSQKLVSWSLTSLFSTNMAMSETKGPKKEKYK